MFHPSELSANFEGELRTVWFAADKLTCSKEHVIDLVNDGDLKYVDIARSGSKHRLIRFTDEQIEEFAKERTRQRSALPVKLPRAKASKANAAVSNGTTFEDRMLNKHGCE
jgi:hypothetical protein